MRIKKKYEKRHLFVSWQPTVDKLRKVQTLRDVFDFVKGIWPGLVLVGELEGTVQAFRFGTLKDIHTESCAATLSQKTVKSYLQKVTVLTETAVHFCLDLWINKEKNYYLNILIQVSPI